MSISVEPAETVFEVDTDVQVAEIDAPPLGEAVGTDILVDGAGDTLVDGAGDTLVGETPVRHSIFELF